MKTDMGYIDPTDSDMPPLPHRGALILFLGVLGFITAGLLGVIAWYLGNADLHKMNAGLMDSRGINSTEYGRILGIISLGLWLVIGALALIFWGLSPLRQG